MNRIDLHVHSNHSDGTMCPSDLVELAQETGLSAFALTDHDTVSGIGEAIKAAKELELKSHSSLKVIPGIEVSALYGNREIHILGLNVDYTNQEFLSVLEKYQNEREKRNGRMVALLAAQGFDISMEKLKKEFPYAVLTRAHFARYLKEHGYVSSMKEAFSRYIGEGASCYLPKKDISPREAISCIRLAGGHPVLAHPPQYNLVSSELEGLVRQLITYGLEGIEAIYSTYSIKEERAMRTLAKKFNLYLTGGSDFHGNNKPNIHMGTGLGELYVPDLLLKNIL